MARSFVAVTPGRPFPEYDGNPEFDHKRSGRRYQAIRRGDRLFQRRYETDSRGGGVKNEFEWEATHVVGSGNHARTYLHRTDAGEIFELPLTWYTQEKRWGMSPGYDLAAPDDFTRTVDDSCLFCHNGYPRADGTLRDGIDCQRCHGPGSEHVALAANSTSSREAVRAAVVNPARLTPDLQMDICMQCHLETTSAALPQMLRRFGREPFSYRPGEPLRAYMVHFDHAPGTGNEGKFEIVNQAYRLRQSQCFLRSAGRLTCASCHDAHAVPRGEPAVAYYRGKCVSCHHAVTTASHPDHAAADCKSCHMPPRRAEDAVHVVMTDHLVQRGPPVRDLTKPLDERRSMYRGPLALYDSRHLPAEERDLYLGAALIVQGADPKRGIALMEPFANRPAKADAVLAEGYFAAGNTERAISAFQAAIQKDPSLPRAHYNLGHALESAGRFEDARAAYEAAVRAEPPFPEGEFALANLLVRLENAAVAGEHYRKAIQARPVYAEAFNNLGNLLADGGQLEQAKHQFEQALRINPGYAEAHNGMARILAAQRRLPEALVYVRRALQLKPDYAEARQNLSLLVQAIGTR